MKKLVRWNNEEIRQLVAVAVVAWLKNAGKLYTWEVFALPEVQAVLPADRRRKIAGWQSLSDDTISAFEAGVNKFVSEAYPAPEVFPVETIVEVVPSLETVLAAATDEQIASVVLQRVKEKLEVVTELNRRLASLSNLMPVTEAQKAPVVIKEPPKPRRVKVALYGFLDSQEQNIRAKASGFDLELVFVNTEGKMKAKPAAGWHIMMVKMMSHKHSGQVEKAAQASDRVITVHGIDGALKHLADINSRVAQGIR